MKRKLKAPRYDEIEKLLFHGTTSDVIDGICKQNFDDILRGKNQAKYGEGSCYAVTITAVKVEREPGSCSWLECWQRIYTRGGRGLRRPPSKDLSDPASDLYDSCVEKEQETMIFAIFNDEKCYLLFLIKYRLQ